MGAIISKLIDQLNSSVFTLLGLLAVAFWALYKLGGMTKTFHFFENKNKDLDANVEGIKTSLASIKATTDLLYQAHLSTIQSHSPLSLTPIGTGISHDLKMEEKVGIHWPEMKEQIEKRNPLNPYDIQSVSMEIAKTFFETLFTETERNEIKLYAYQKGKNLLEIIPIIGIIVRDRFLKEKGIPTEAIDLHTPKTNN